MKRVLLFSIHYPPTNSPASGRSGCMAKYLPKYGWIPMVVAGQTPGDLLIDHSYVRDLPHEYLAAEIPYNDKGYLASVFRYEGLIRSFRPGFYPGKWISKAIQKLPRILNTNTINAIWATYPPVGTLYLADYCSRKFGIPWIADFRDFPGEHGLPKTFYKRLKMYREISDYKRVIKSASTITTVSKGLADMIRKENRQDVYNIMNGFDPDDMDDNNTSVFKKFNIVFIGSFYKNMSPKPILEALAELLDSRTITEKDVVVSFYCFNRNELINELKGYPYPEIFSVYPCINREECYKICRSNLVLMLPGPHPPGVLTSKIFTYLASQRPILAGPDSSDCIKEILGETNAGIACSSVQDITDVILKWYQEWKKTGMVKYNGRKEAIMKYSRDKQAGQLAELLDSICLRQEVLE
ncbi:MAG: glycosyltransferase family 4 protein [Planctomycetes bacterium]|nr:glycosyltransferase family 4 protein [Planctomycetota bacterium]